jgi:hypothetical protein
VLLTKEVCGLPQRGEPRGAEEARLHEALEQDARLFAFCFLGPDDYGERCADGAVQAARLDLAAAAPEGREARIVSLALLTQHAHASLAERFEAIL